LVADNKDSISLSGFCDWSLLKACEFENLENESSEEQEEQEEQEEEDS